MDIKSVIASVAPTIASFIGGPLAGGAVKAGLAAFGITNTPEGSDEAELLAKKIQSASPDDLLKLREADNKFKVAMRKLDLDEQKIYVGDTSDARHVNAENDAVFVLGCIVLATFAVMMGFSMYGAYLMVTGGMGKDIDPGIVAAVFSFLGTIVGYVAANAQQVISFFFGSSKGSKSKTDAMSKAFKSLSVS